MNRQSHHQIQQSPNQNGNIKAFKFQFDLMIEHISIAIPFPCAIQIIWNRGTNKIFTKNKSPLNLETGQADINESLSILTTIFQNEKHQVLPKKSSLTAVIQASMGNKVGGVAILNLNEFLKNDNQSLTCKLFEMNKIKIDIILYDKNKAMRGYKHTTTLEQQLQKCPDKNAYIKVHVTAQFISECLDTETMSVGSCGSRVQNVQEGEEYLIDQTADQMSEQRLSSQKKTSKVDQNNFTFSLNSVKSGDKKKYDIQLYTEPSLKDRTHVFAQYDNISRVPSKEELEDTIRHKKRLLQYNISPSSQSNLKKEKLGIQNILGDNELNELKYENQRLKDDLIKVKFKHDTNQQNTMLNMEAENQKYKSSFKLLEKEKEEKIEEIKKMQKKIDELTEKDKQSQNKQDEIQEELRKHKKSNDKILEQLEDLKKEYRREMEEKQILINKIKKDKQQLEEDVEQLKNNQIESIEMSKQAQNKNNELRQNQKQILDQFDNLKKERLYENERYEKQIEFQKQQINNTFENSKKIQANYDQLSQQTTQEKLQIQQTILEIIEKNKQLVSQIKAYQIKIYLQVKELEEKVDELENQISIKDSEIEQYRDEIQEKEIEIAQQIKNMQELKQKIQAAQQKTQQDFTLELSEKDDIIEEQLTQIQRLNSEYEENLRHFEQHKEQLDDRINSLLQIKTQMEQALKNSEQNNHIYEQNLQKKEEQMQLQNERYLMMEQNFEKQKQLNIQMNEKYNVIKEEKDIQIQKMNEQLNILQKEQKKEQKIEINQHVQEIDTLKSQMEEQQQIYLKQDSVYKKQIQKLTRVNEKLEQENVQLYLRMMKDLDSIEKKQDSFSNEFTKMIQEKQKLNQSITSNN